MNIIQDLKNYVIKTLTGECLMESFSIPLSNDVTSGGEPV